MRHMLPTDTADVAAVLVVDLAQAEMRIVSVSFRLNNNFAAAVVQAMVTIGPANEAAIPIGIGDIGDGQNLRCIAAIGLSALPVRVVNNATNTALVLATEAAQGISAGLPDVWWNQRVTLTIGPAQGAGPGDAVTEMRIVVEDR